MPLFSFKTGKKSSVDDELVNFRINSKQIQRSANKCHKKETQSVQKVKKSIQQGNAEGARMHAQNAIREKNHNLQCQKLASRTDAASSRIESGVRMGEVAKGMQSATKSMDVGLKSMNTAQVSKTMDKFERQFEDLDIKSAYMDNAMNRATVTSTPVNEVDELIRMVADENNLQLGEQFSGAGTINNRVPYKSHKVKSKYAVPS